MSTRLPAAAFGPALLAALPLHAQPPVIPQAAADGPFAPPKSLAPANGAAVYVPPATVVDARYVPLDGEAPFDPRSIGGSKTAFVFLTRGLPAGKTYRFVGVASDDKGALTEVTFGVTIPGEPGPPGPPPKPPEPNPYRAALKAAFDADPGEAGAKNELRLELVALYRQGAKLTTDPSVATTDQLRGRLREAAAMLAADRLVGVRTAVSQLAAPALPLGLPLDADRRRQAAELFTLVAEALAW